MKRIKEGWKKCSVVWNECTNEFNILLFLQTALAFHVL